MAVLTDEEKRKIAKRFVTRAYKELLDIADLDADQIIAAIQPTEDWIELNQGLFNAALPLPFRSTATAAQKTLLFTYVAFNRAGLL
jgi:hypothetical protein